MPKKKNESFGLFKITEHKTKMIELGNGIKLKLAEGSVEGRIHSVTVIGRLGKEQETLIASEVVQIAEAIRAVDRSKRFICGYHGSYETTNRRQPASCPTCEQAKVAMHSGNVTAGNVQLEEEDA